ARHFSFQSLLRRRGHSFVLFWTLWARERYADCLLCSMPALPFRLRNTLHALPFDLRKGVGGLSDALCIGLQASLGLPDFLLDLAAVPAIDASGNRIEHGPLHAIGVGKFDGFLDEAH